ncbi:hypothetical protein I3843_10G119900 [Carya illinoinensis]|nr:hypothetical protein I3843_10G119900 [Carya illinoinensis]
MIIILTVHLKVELSKTKDDGIVQAMVRKLFAS